MISKQIFSLNFMFLSLLIKELCTNEENNKVGCTLIFGGQCILTYYMHTAQFRLCQLPIRQR